MFERELWQQVLLQAVNDALHGVPGGMSNKAVRIRDTHAARDYLTTPSQDLSMVCNLAGLDPVAVIERMRKQIAAAPTPEELIVKPITNVKTYGRVRQRDQGIVLPSY